jgi:serine/threonine-protein kinase
MNTSGAQDGGHKPALPANDPDKASTVPPRDDAAASTSGNARGSTPSPAAANEETGPDLGATGSYLGAGRPAPPPMSGTTGGAPQGRTSADAIPGYEIVDVLGRGGMGVVYQALHLRLKRPVALKMILAGGHAGPDMLARFRTEAEAVARLQHPNIVQVFEVGEHQDLPFLALEFCGGGSLAMKLAGTPLPPKEAAALVETLARAVQAAHDKGVVHRDLKPANVLLGEDGAPKITDFGLAKKLDEAGQTLPGAVMGTPSYMAPEQAEGKTDVGPPADVYALGAILYECLAGRPPFRAATSQDTILQVVSVDPVPPRDLNAKVPRDLDTICLKCLEKEPDRRYASALDLADDLRHFLNEEPIRARATTPWERLLKWRRRNPRVAVLSGSIALVVLLWAVSASWLSLSLQDEIGKKKQALADAKTNEETAKRNEETAKKNEERAIRNEQIAKDEQKFAIDHLINVGKSGLARHLRQPANAGGLTPEAARSEVLHDVRGQLMAMADRMNLSRFNRVAVHQQAGDFARDIGLLRVALSEYQEGYKIVKEITQEQPDQDKARANMAVMLLRLGNTTWELSGDTKMARACFERARQARQEVADHPHSKEYSLLQNRIALAYSAVDQGRLELVQGNLPAAKDHLAEALETRRAWMKEAPAEESDMAESFLSEACLCLGRILARQGDREGADMYLQEALQLCDRLAAKEPKEPNYQIDLGEIHCGRGEVELLRGKWEEAARNFEKAHQHLRVLADKSEDVSRRALLARTHEGLAAAAEKNGKVVEGLEHRQASLKVWEDLLRIEPICVSWRAAQTLALAHTGRPAEADVKELTDRAAGNCELLLKLARYHAVRAGKAAAPDQRRAAAESALALLDDAVKAGYADRLTLTGDPDLAPLQQDAGFRALLDRLPR